MVEAHCYYCVHAEGKCPECHERSAFVPTKEANAIRVRFRRVPIEGGED